MVYVIQVCEQYPARKMSANLYDIYHCCVYSEKLLMMDCSKHVEFCTKNKFQKLVHLVGLIKGKYLEEYMVLDMKTGNGKVGRIEN